MAITVLSRPKGYVLDYYPDNFGDATASNNAGEVLFTRVGHGIPDESIIYITCNIESYNGFWIADVFSSSTFGIRDIVTDDPVEFTRASSACRYHMTVYSHGWSCVHLPIVYQLSTDRWPANNIDTARNISTVTDSNGYCAIVSSGEMRTGGTIAVLDYVKITNATDSSLNGQWQVISVTDDTTFVIEIPYSAANDTALTGATIQFVYNNYFVKVQVYGGLNITHTWEELKPYELISTLKLVPDSNNEIKFSIANELKKQISSLTNNTSLDTLPNNLDAFTMFYITTQEVYDFSNGSTVTSLSEGILVDRNNFEGFAVNAELPFKNIHSGFLSDYIVDTANDEHSEAKFLTLFERPVIFNGYFFDISAILNFDNTTYYDLPSLYLTKKFLNSSGVVQASSTELISNQDAGVYRFQLEADCDYSAMTIQIASADDAVEILPPDTDWTDVVGVWTKNGVSLSSVGAAWSNGAGTILTSVRQPISLSAGNVVADFNIVLAVNVISGQVRFVITTDAPGVSYMSPVYSTPVTGQALTVSGISAGATNASFLIIQVVAVSASGSVNGITIQLPVGQNVFLNGTLTEEKTLDIACNCNNQDTEGIQLTWLNYLGGMEYFVFTAQKEHQIEVKESKTRMKNIFSNWPKSYGEHGNTIRQETSRKSCFRKMVRSQRISIENLEAIQYIKTSSLVQIMVSETDLRTVLVDTDSFVVYNDNDKEFSISFNIEYTDYIPSQSL